MKQLAGYVFDYVRDVNKQALFFIAILTGFFIFLNYQFHVESSLLRFSRFGTRFTGFLLLYVLTFGGSYAILYSIRSAGTRLKPSIFFVFLILLSAVLFAWRMSSRLVTSSFTADLNEPWNRYWALILNPPFKCIIILFFILFIKWAGSYTNDITGLQSFRLKPARPSIRPFVIILCCFAPVVLIAGMQPEFRMAYPKAAKVNFILNHFSRPWIAAILFEISYAFDFVVAEVFFRGFLVLAFIRYAGAAAILPMAAFYCAIHFGKPAVECVSSFFGAIVLGAITWRTRSVVGGLVLHLGIGWMMEITGFLLR